MYAWAIDQSVKKWLIISITGFKTSPWANFFVGEKVLKLFLSTKVMPGETKIDVYCNVSITVWFKQFNHQFSTCKIILNNKNFKRRFFLSSLANLNCRLKQSGHVKNQPDFSISQYSTACQALNFFKSFADVIDDKLFFSKQLVQKQGFFLL